ncbi:MAG: DivIVA domain-containing protein [Acidimicrobiaceae bacterium]|nr:DivIVA domain-containing protein [Acidimicrobiaceae bacterium]
MTEGGKELEIGSKVVREVEFRERIRGYHQDDVDEFLEKVALGIEILEDRLKEAERRAELAEESAGSQAGPGAVQVVPMAEDDIIQRTLLLAQRTADQVLAEARENAERIQAAAQEEASGLLDEVRRQVDVDLATKVIDLQGQIESLGDEKARLEGQLAAVASEILEAKRSAAQLLRNTADELDDNSGSSVILASSAPDNEFLTDDGSDGTLWSGNQAQDFDQVAPLQTQGLAEAPFEVQTNGEFDGEDQDEMELPSYVSHESPSFDIAEQYSEADEDAPIPSFEIDTNSLDEESEEDEELFLDFGRSKFQLLEDDSDLSSPKIFDDDSEK